jgi:F-type H+-transporting ATPase subunit delta
MATTFIDPPPDALDKIYAQSLFELAESKGGRAFLEELSQEIEEFEEMRGRDPQIMEFFRSRVIPAAAKVEALRKVLTGRVSPVLGNLLMLLARKERLDRVWRIFTAFSHLLDERFGKVEVDVYTRFPVPPDQGESLRQRLQDALKREPVIHFYIDPGMIGGMRVQVGDKLVDASIDTRLRRMREQLIDQGGSAVRGRMGNILE